MHYSDSDTIKRDKKKNSICKKLGMPLFRIDSQYLRRAGKFSIVGWLTELWFIYEAFVEAQEDGSISMYEPFLYCNVVGYDPFIPSYQFVAKEYKKGNIPLHVQK